MEVCAPPSTTLPGCIHDVCSAIHPMAAASPFFQAVPLRDHGLEYIDPPVLAAHPFDGGHAAILLRSLEQAASVLGKDKNFYLSTFAPLLKEWPGLVPDLLGPIGIPRHPVAFSRFGLKAIASARYFARKFSSREAQGLFAGMAAHSVQPLTNLASAAIGIVLMTAGHASGWPIVRGGSQGMANALASYFVSLGGTIETGHYVTSLSGLPSAKAILLDVTPRQLLEIADKSLSSLYRWQLRRYRYGMGIYKIDWALDGPVPFAAAACNEAGTVHLGNTLEEITRSEDEVSRRIHPEQPFLLLDQQSRFRFQSRAESKTDCMGILPCSTTGSNVNMTEAIEKQIERFALGVPGPYSPSAAAHNEYCGNAKLQSELHRWRYRGRERLTLASYLPDLYCVYHRTELRQKAFTFVLHLPLPAAGYMACAAIMPRVEN